METNNIMANKILAVYGQDLIKGGEGSRGGKVIGHTDSGKPIYDNPKHESHKHFTASDHYDASGVHQELGNKHDEISTGAGSKDKHDEHEGIAGEHYDFADYHKRKYKELKGIKKSEPLRDFHNVGEFDADGLEPHTVIKKDVGDSNDYAVIKSEGEGSRGGQVVNHTKSGKPIYENKLAKHPAYHDFSKQDHQDAADHHGRSGAFHVHMADKYYDEDNKEWGDKHSNLSNQHHSMMTSHLDKMKQNDHQIAHTSSGKAVYEDHNHPSHENFDKQDHRDAADAHEGLRKHHWDKSMEHDKRELDLKDHELFGPKHDEIHKDSRNEWANSRQHEISKYHHLQEAVKKS